MKKLLSVFATVLLCLWHAPAVEAVSVDCVADTGCPKGQKPPKCCTLPKCEFFYSLMMARAQLYAVSHRAQLTAMMIAVVDEDEGGREYRRTLRKILNEARASNRKCPTKDFHVEPPYLWIHRPGNNQCLITSYATGERAEIGLEEFHLRSNTCSEVVDAEWDKALQQQFQCNRSYDESRPYDDSLEGFRRREESAARAKVRSLEADLLNFRRACTMVTDGQIARRVAKLGLKGLQEAAKKKPKAKKKAKRKQKQKKVKR